MSTRTPIFDYKTAADLCAGKPVPGDLVKAFVSDARSNSDALFAMACRLDALSVTVRLRDAEIETIKGELLACEALKSTVANKGLGAAQP